MSEMRYEFKITLHSVHYDRNEVGQEINFGTRKHIGTEDSAIAFARRTRTQATTARIERVMVVGGEHDGVRFQPHEANAFTVDLDPR